MPRNRKRTGSSAASQVPRSKAGCWTCRIRRKRCDEQADERGYCLACRRLDIECLGWGSRRPEWCRDKDALTAYKLNLKKKLCSRAGTRPSAKSRAAAAARAGDGASTSADNGNVDGHEHGDGEFDPEFDLDGETGEMDGMDNYEFEGEGTGRAPSGESPRGSSRSVHEESEIADNKYDSNTMNGVKDFYYGARHHRTNSNATNVTNVSALSGFTSTSFDTFSSPAFSPQSDLSVLFSPNGQLNSLPILSPLSPLSTHHIHRQTAKSQPQIMSSLTARLRQLLPILSVPQEYAKLTSQILDLHDLKNAPHSQNSEREVKVAQQARHIESELNRLAHRASFDGLLSNAIGLGLGFDFTAPSTTSYLSPPSAVSHNHTHGGVSLGVDNVFGSPLAMWSPDLMSDSMSTFSGGSSVPTSPAMNGAINSNASFGDLFGYDSTAPSNNVSTDPWFNSMNMSMGGLDLGMNFGALGLSNDNFGVDSSPTTATAPSIALFPPAEPTVALTKPSPLNSRASTIVANPLTAATTNPSTPADPYQIQHETCTLLLQAVLNPQATTPSTLFDSHFNNFSGFENFNDYNEFGSAGSNAVPVEDSLQRMVSKFSSVFPNQNQTQAVPSEYLLAATVAGALSSTSDRRLFFKRVVDSIESRLGTNVCANTLNEAWA